MANGAPDPQDPAGQGVVPNSPAVGYSTVWYGTSYKVGLEKPKFSNIDVGPAGASMVVNAGNEAAGLEYLAATVNKFMNDQREKAVQAVLATGGIVNS